MQPARCELTRALAGPQARTGVLASRRRSLSDGFAALAVALAIGFIGSIAAVGSAAAQEPTPLPGPVELILAIDTSGSMFGEPLDAAANAGRACVAGLPQGSSAAVIAYSTQPVLLHPPSADLGAVSASLSALVATGETATHDALIASSRQFSEATGATPDNRYVVLLSDGNDTASQRSGDDAVTAVRDANAKLWVVAVETGDSDLASLEGLAGQAGAALIRTGPGGLAAHCTGIARTIVEEQQQLAIARRSGPSGTSVGADSGQSSSLSGTDTASAGETAVLPGGSEDPALDAAELPDGEGNGASSRSEGGSAGPAGAGLAEVPLGTGGDGSAGDQQSAEFPAPPPNLASTSEQVASSARALWFGAVAVFASLATMFGLVFVPSHSAMVARTVSLRVDRSVQDKPKRGGIIGRAAGSTSGLVESIMNSRGLGTSMNDSLDAAGINLRPSEFVAATGALAILMSVLGAVLANPLVFIGGAIGVPFAARTLLKTRSAKRTKQFQEQLVETLMLMSGSVRAGHGLMQSIGSVAEQASEPTSTEFSRVITEVRIGRDPIDSLQAMAERVDSVDLVWTVRAMALNRELGGNLAEILDNISDTIRERNKIADQVRALSAEGKFSAYVLFGLPFGVVFAVRLLNPEYIEPLFNTTKGYTIIGISLTLMTVGAIWIRKMIKIEY